MSLLLRKLNAYPEWRTKSSIKSVAKYLDDVEKDKEQPSFPASIKTKHQQKRFTSKFGNNFQVEGSRSALPRVYYRPALESDSN